MRLNDRKMDDFPDAEGLYVYAADGERIGKVWTTLFDETTREPDWISVATGLFGRKRVFIPVQGAQLNKEGIDVAYTKEEIENSPDVDPTINPEDVGALFDYYAQLDSEEEVDTTLLKRVARPAEAAQEDEGPVTRADGRSAKAEPDPGQSEPIELGEQDEEVTFRRALSLADTLLARANLVGEMVERRLEKGEIERVAVEGEDSGEVEILPDGSVSIPLLEEQVVLTKRVLVRERIIVRKTTVSDLPLGSGPAR